ncbi:Xaa-Pro aminopeptidase [Clostridium cavendishii DSM 21758]|uniref:Xaa-Pro aminopeptidase n=1 Tax=Clostridium cavendishii DSM 21758 TaxID=1121302 RepID=A0A1M6SJC3_9CLOT|nr:Xaa-Pro peptidase family protein [Clostridium cavendishii]SHK44746.1 Xaa-Pro aminopeptidase [Clostridium cavendishii DSM 21758]
MNKRIKKIQKLLVDKNVDCILIKSKSNKKYINALTGSGVNVLVTRNKAFQIMDGRYVNEAKESNTEFEILVYSQGGDYISKISELMNAEGYNKLAIEGNQILVKDYLKMEKVGLKLVLFTDELDELRKIKDFDEINLVRKACEITDYIFDEAIKEIKVGMKEYELSAYIQYLAIKNGASQMAFDTIVASGVRGAMPHGRPTSKAFMNNEAITIDFGITYEGYQSDMTRTIFIGEPRKEIRKIYDVVKEAQMLGISTIKKGSIANEVDKAVREYIYKQGYGEYFTHGLGHGIGMGDGEFPILNPKSTTLLEDGMIMSCEPGIYIPGIGGVRIEDDVLIENGIGVPLNKTSKEYIILKEK